MAEYKDMFSSIGSLRVCVIEAIDVFSTVDNKNKKLTHNVNKFYVTVSIGDRNGKEIVKYNTSPQAYFGGETSKIGEEFIFDGVSSSNSLIVTFYSVGMSTKLNPTSSCCIGATVIPVSRLEENISVVQWYQMFSPAAQTDGLRCAAKIESLFANEGLSAGKSFKKKILGGHTPGGKGSAHQTPRHHKQPSLDSTGPLENATSRHNMADLGEVVLDIDAADGVTAPPVFHSPRRQSAEQHDLTLSVLPNPTPSSSSHLRRWFNRLPGNESIPMEAESEFERAQRDRLRQSLDLEHNHVLDCGIIDYCLVLGPSSPYTLYPSHHLDHSGRTQQIVYAPASAAGMHRQQRSNTSSGESYSGEEAISPGSGLFSGNSSEAFGAGMDELDLLLYDRLPRQDHPDVELPSKIEWFACPEGTKTVLHPHRPEPYFSSFVLSAGGDSEEQYGLSLNFFVDVSILETTSSTSHSPPAKYKTSTFSAVAGQSNGNDVPNRLDVDNLLWWHPAFANDAVAPREETKDSSSSSSSSSGHRMKKWTTVTVCVLFRYPFIQQLTTCLRSAYTDSILPHLVEWEAARNDGIAQQLHVSAAAPSLNGSLTLALVDRVRGGIKPFPMFIDKLLATLCLECPVPLPGILAIDYRLPQPNTNNDSELRDRATKSVLFSLPKSEALPRCTYPIESLLKFFGARSLIDVVCCVLSECRILFHSTDLTKLPVVCETLRTLIYPLQWTHVYLPIVPVHLLNLVEAPVPFMLGTHSKWLKHIHLEYLSDMVLVDCDTGAIDMGVAEATRFPDLEDRWLMAALNSIHFPAFADESRGCMESFVRDRAENKVVVRFGSDESSRQSSTKDETCSADLQIQLLFFDVLFQLLRFVPDCLFYLNPSCPVFNRPLFINEYTPDEYRACLEFVTVTNSFHELTETIHSDALSFFAECISRVVESEKREIEQSIGSNSAQHIEADLLTPNSSRPGSGGSGSLHRHTSFISPRPGSLRPQNSCRSLTKTLSMYNRPPLTGGSHSAAATPNSKKQARRNPRHFAFDEEFSEEEKEGVVKLASAFSQESVDPLDDIPVVAEPNGISLSHSTSPEPTNRRLSLTKSVAMREDDFPPLSPSPQSKQLSASIASPSKAPPPRGIVSQRSGRGMMRTVSVMGIGATGPVGDMQSPAPQLTSGATIVDLNGGTAAESANEVVYRGLFPVWLLQLSPLAKNKVVSEKLRRRVDSVRVLLQNRVNIYLPYVASGSAEMASPAQREHTLQLRSEYSSLHRSNYSFTLPPSRHTRPATLIENRTPLFQVMKREHRRILKQESVELIRDEEGLDKHTAVYGSQSLDLSSSQEVGADSPFPLHHDLQTLQLVNRVRLEAEGMEQGGVAGRKSNEQQWSEDNSVNDESDLDESDLEEQDEGVDSNVAHLLCRFDDASVDEVQRQVFCWTLFDVADKVGVSRDSLVKQIRAADQSSSTARQKASLAGKTAHQKSIISHAKSQNTLHKLNTAHSKLRCDDTITEFLQKVVTQSDMDAASLQGAIDQCLVSLKDAENRLGLISILKHAKKSDDHFDRSASSNVYPLNSTAFEGFSKLLNGLLIICSNLQDYLCAYGLLEVGGLYFHILQESDAHSRSKLSMSSYSAGDDTDMIEFLSERISTHPIYQNVSLWRDVLLDRLPIDSISPEKAKQAQQSRRDSINTMAGTPSTTRGDEGVVNFSPNNKKSGHKPFFNGNNTNTVISEAHSLLYVMLGMGVNSARALHFIQMIAADYSLGINEYFKMQRFTTRLWTASGLMELEDGVLTTDFNDDDFATGSEHNTHNYQPQLAMSSVDSHHTKASLSRKKSKDGRLDRRTSMSITDMLAKQGHKLLKHTASRDSVGESAYHHHGTGAHRSLSPDHVMKRANSTDMYGYDIRTMSMDEMLGPNTDHLDAVLASSGGYSKHGNASGHGSGKKLMSTSVRAFYDKHQGVENHNTSDISLDNEDRQHNSDEINLAMNTLRNAGGDLGPRTQSDLHSSSFLGLNARIDSSYGFDGDLALFASPGLKINALAPIVEAHSEEYSPRRRDDTNSNSNSNNSRSRTSTGDSAADPGFGLSKFLPGIFGDSSVDKSKHDAHSLGSSNASKPRGSGSVCSEELNKYKPFEIQAVEDGHVTVFDTLHNYLLCGADDGQLVVSDLANGSQVMKMKHGSRSGDKYTGITTVASLPSCAGNGYVFFSGCSAGMAKAWTLPAKTIEQHNHQMATRTATTSSYWGGVSLGNMRTKTALAVIKTHSASICSMVAVPYEGQSWVLASGDNKGEVAITRGSESSSSTVSVGANLHMPGAFSAASGSGGLSARTSSFVGSKFNITTMAFLGRAFGTTDAPKTMRFDKDHKKNSASGGTAPADELLVVGTSNGLLTVLDAHTAKPIYFAESHKGAVTKVLGLRSDMFLSAGADRSIKLWDIRTKNRTGLQAFGSVNKALEERHLGAADSYGRCAASPISSIAVGGWDNTLVISASADGFIRLWDLRHDVNVPCSVVRGHSNRISAISWNGRDEFHTASHDGTVRSWDSISGRNLNILRAFDGQEGVVGLGVTSFAASVVNSAQQSGESSLQRRTGSMGLSLVTTAPSTRTCIVAGSWSGVVKGFYHDS